MTRHVRPALALAALVAALACTRGQEEPTRPDGLAGRDLIPEAPLAQPSPSPTPDLTGILDPGGGVGGGGFADMGICGAPTPGPISRLSVKILFTQEDRVVLDATPLVGPDAAYCSQIGFTDGRLYCPVRPDGHPERIACEAERVGRATDTGRIGPTWTADGRPCRGKEAGTSCANHPDNQFLVFAYGSGTFRACASGGACGQRVLP